MKKLFLAFAASVMAFSVSAAELNIYASGLKSGEVADGKVKISYVLNAPATALEVQVLDAEGAIAKTIAIADEALLAKGAHADVEIDLAGLAGGTYHWALKASAAATEALVDCTPATEGLYNYYLPQGLAINFYPETEYFGYIYIAEGTDGASDGGSDRADNMTEGIYIYDPLLADYTNQGWVGYEGGVEWAADRQGPKRIQVAEDGTLFICDNGAETSGVWMMDPANPSADFKAALDPAGRGTNYIKVNAIDVVGTGADRVLYTLDNISTSGTGTANAYAIGECATPFAGAATSIFSPNAVTLGVQDNTIAADGRGGFWLAQNRWGDDVYKALIHVNAEGAADLLADTTLLPFTNNISYRGVLSLNKDKSLLAFGSDGCGVVFSIAWDEAGVPTLTELYRTAYVGGNIDGVAFDYADNFYLVTASKELFHAYATPKADNSCVTPAAKQYTLSVAGESTGIDNASLESVKVRKVIENGQVVIIKDGVRYNVLGTVIN